MTSTLLHEVRELAPGGRYRFGAFEIDLDAELVTRDGERVAMAPQPFRLLRYLLHSGGRMLTREELTQAVWGTETFVDFDRGLNFCVLQLRTALQDDARQPAYIETVPRKGYRFIAEVTPIDAAPRDPRRSASRVTLIAGAVLLIGALAAMWILTRTRPAPPSGKVMLAVLPLQNLSGANDAYLVDGLTEETITDLAQVAPDRLGVVARTSVEQFRNSSKDIRAIAKSLRVDFVLEGSVRRQNDRIRATFQLIRASDQTHVWSESFDRDARDVFGLQSLLAHRVADALEVTLLAHPNARHDPRAFDEYLRGRTSIAKRHTADVEAGIEHLQKAVAIEPGFASAQAALAEGWRLLDMRGKLASPDARRRIRSAVEAALRADSSVASAHSVAGMLAFYYDWDFEGAERELTRALRINPGDGGARHDYAWLLIARGRAGEGIEQIRRAQELDPLSPRATIDIAWAYIYSGRYDEAIAEAKRSLGQDPEFEEAHRCLQHAYEMKGDVVSAAAQARLRNAAESGDSRVLLAHLHEQQLASLLSSPAGDPYVIAQELAWLGRSDEALRRLDVAFEQHSDSMPLMGADPMLASLRKSPRFQDLLHRVGLV